MPMQSWRKALPGQQHQCSGETAAELFLVKRIIHLLNNDNNMHTHIPP